MLRYSPSSFEVQDLTRDGSGLIIKAIYYPTSGRKPAPDKPDGPDTFRVNVQIDGGRTEYHVYGWPTRRILEGEASILRSAVTAAADNTDLCRQYVKDLLEEVQRINPSTSIISTDIDVLFTEILRSRDDVGTSGGVFLREEPSGGDARNSWHYKNGPGYADIRIGVGNPVPHLAVSSSISLAQVANGNIIAKLSAPKTGMLMIHELMHVAVKGAGSDEDFALAAANLAGDPAPDFKYDPTKPKSPTNRGENFQASEYWGDRLEQACGFPSSISGKMTNFKLYK